MRVPMRVKTVTGQTWGTMEPYEANGQTNMHGDTNTRAGTMGTETGITDSGKDVVPGAHLARASMEMDSASVGRSPVGKGGMHQSNAHVECASMEKDFSVGVGRSPAGKSGVRQSNAQGGFGKEVCAADQLGDVSMVCDAGDDEVDMVDKRMHIVVEDEGDDDAYMVSVRGDDNLNENDELRECGDDHVDEDDDNCEGGGDEDAVMLDDDDEEEEEVQVVHAHAHDAMHTKPAAQAEMPAAKKASDRRSLDIDALFDFDPPMSQPMQSQQEAAEQLNAHSRNHKTSKSPDHNRSDASIPLRESDPAFRVAQQLNAHTHGHKTSKSPDHIRSDSFTEGKSPSRLAAAPQDHNITRSAEPLRDSNGMETRVPAVAVSEKNTSFTECQGEAKSTSQQGGNSGNNFKQGMHSASHERENEFEARITSQQGGIAGNNFKQAMHGVLHVGENEMDTPLANRHVAVPGARAPYSTAEMTLDTPLVNRQVARLHESAPHNRADVSIDTPLVNRQVVQLHESAAHNRAEVSTDTPLVNRQVAQLSESAQGKGPASNWRTPETSKKTASVPEKSNRYLCVCGYVCVVCVCVYIYIYIYIYV